MIVRKTNPCPLPGSPTEVWWCTDCNRVVDWASEDKKPEACPLGQCVAAREEKRRATDPLFRETPVLAKAPRVRPTSW